MGDGCPRCGGNVVVRYVTTGWIECGECHAKWRIAGALPYASPAWRQIAEELDIPVRPPVVGPVVGPVDVLRDAARIRDRIARALEAEIRDPQAAERLADVVVRELEKSG